MSVSLHLQKQYHCHKVVGAIFKCETMVGWIWEKEQNKIKDNIWSRGNAPADVAVMWLLRLVTSLACDFGNFLKIEVFTFASKD